jgi:hypothetical protein
MQETAPAIAIPVPLTRGNQPKASITPCRSRNGARSSSPSSRFHTQLLASSSGRRRLVGIAARAPGKPLEHRTLRYPATPMTRNTSANTGPTHGIALATATSSAQPRVSTIACAVRVARRLVCPERANRPPVEARGTVCSAWHDQHLTVVPACSAFTRKARPHWHVNCTYAGIGKAYTRTSANLAQAASPDTQTRQSSRATGASTPPRLAEFRASAAMSPDPPPHYMMRPTSQNATVNWAKMGIWVLYRFSISNAGKMPCAELTARRLPAAKTAAAIRLKPIQEIVTTSLSKAVYDEKCVMVYHLHQHERESRQAGAQAILECLLFVLATE